MMSHPQSGIGFTVDQLHLLVLEPVQATLSFWEVEDEPPAPPFRLADGPGDVLHEAGAPAVVDVVADLDLAHRDHDSPPEDPSISRTLARFISVAQPNRPMLR